MAPICKFHEWIVSHVTKALQRCAAAYVIFKAHEICKNLLAFA